MSETFPYSVVDAPSVVSSMDPRSELPHPSPADIIIFTPDEDVVRSVWMNYYEICAGKHDFNQAGFDEAVAFMTWFLERELTPDEVLASKTRIMAILDKDKESGSMSEQPTNPGIVDYHQFGGSEWFAGENGDEYPVHEPQENDEGENDDNSN